MMQAQILYSFLRFSCIARFFPACFALLLLVGCSKLELQEFNQAYYSGEVEEAYKMAKDASNLSSSKEKPERDDLLWQVQAGVAGFFSQQEDTHALLESADRIMQNTIENFSTMFFGSVGAILTSDELLPYPIYLYEASLVNYYLALDAMAQDDSKNARVHLNQAIERQNDAKAYYAKEIEESQKDLKGMKKTSDKDSKDSQFIAASVDFAMSRRGEGSSAQVRENYINPMIPYMKILFELKEGRFSNIASLSALDLAFLPREDREILEARKRGAKERYIWVIIEDGKGVSKGTRSFSIPLPANPSALLNPALLAIALSSQEGAVVAAAVSGSVLLNYAEPLLIEGIDFARSYSIEGVSGSKFFSLDSLAKTEFDKRLAGIRTRAILRSIPPAIAAYASERAGQEAGVSGIGVLFGLMHKMVISADERIISALPNSFHVLRIPNTQGVKALKVDGKNMLEFSISHQDKDAIVYVRNTGTKLFMRILN